MAHGFSALNTEVTTLQTRVIILVDLDYFFAQAEELRNPALKGKPVVVGMYSGRTADSGAVSTSNYEARKYGVKSGIPLFLAKKRLEGTEAVFLPVDYNYYEQISGKIMQILREYADGFEQVGIDEAYLDVTKRTGGDFEAAKTLVQEMKRAVKSQVGVTFSAGIAPNKLVAKIASDVQKPDGVTAVLPSEVERFLAPLPVDKLLGVGRKTSAKMASLGIKTIGDLARYDPQRLIEVFGKTLGAYFHNAANGIDNEPVQEAGEAESISRISTLKEDTRDIVAIIEKTGQQVEEIGKEIAQRGVRFKQVGIIAVMTDLTAKTRIQTLEQPTNDLEVLRKTVREIFEKYLSESQLEIRRVGVKIAQLTKEETQQKQLTSFFQPSNV
ncbi:MAG: DNA polymerase IV [Candidatus Bathyarchaeota archaeon]|nr:DNA polymerase IV [Candidatus Bathyarchaeota archaeon]